MSVHPLVGIIMGSESDWPVMRAAAEALDEMGVPYEATIVSAHRTPQRLYDYARAAQGRGLRLLIAGAGGAAHLPGMAAALTPLPVLGVPVRNGALQGLDALLSIVQMPAGVPVATVAIDGARNAAVLAVRILALQDPGLADKVQAQMQAQESKVLAQARSWDENGPPQAQQGPA
jgi:5-(carboxyamino)imidazole ribonucleotide mutase